MTVLAINSIPKPIGSFNRRFSESIQLFFDHIRRSPVFTNLAPEILRTPLGIYTLTHPSAVTLGRLIQIQATFVFAYAFTVTGLLFFEPGAFFFRQSAIKAIQPS